MSQALSELCALLVCDLYGELSSRVFSILLRCGRSTVANLAHHSTISPKYLRHALSVLTQQNLATHYTDDVGRTFYEADWQHAYALARVGRALQLIEERHKDESGSIAANLLLLGHTRVKNLAEAYGVNNSGPQANGTNKRKLHATNEILSRAQLDEHLNMLHRVGFISRVQDHHFRSAGDLHKEAVLAVSQQSPKDGKVVKKPDERQRELEMKRRWRDEAMKEERRPTKAARKLVGSQQPPKKRRKANGHAAVHEMEESDSEREDNNLVGILNDDLVFRLNHEKCEVALRNRLLVRLAAHHLGQQTASVFEALLSCIEARIPRCRDELSVFENEDEEEANLPWATTRSVLDKLKPDINLSLADFGKRLNGTHRHTQLEHGRGTNGRATVSTVSNDGAAPQSPIELSSLQIVDEHLQLLAQDPREFVTASARGQWKVKFRPLTLHLIRHEMDEIIRHKFGEYGGKIVRLLRDKGKLEEKQLCAYALLQPRDLRKTLTIMQQAGYLDEQEVPKEPSRQPSRTIYLWFFDEQRCRQLILNDLYKSMSRTLQRNQHEQSVIQSVIDKAERTDVKGNEDALLTTVEKTALACWLDTESQLLTQLGRQDDVVAILRDFQMPDLSGTS